METLEFKKKGSKYEAEITVSSDFNLHIEREQSGVLYVQQRTSENGAFDSISGANFGQTDTVIDYDFVGSIYPKHIKVVSGVLPTMAVVTFAE